MDKGSNIDNSPVTEYGRRIGIPEHEVSTKKMVVRAIGGPQHWCIPFGVEVNPQHVKTAGVAAGWIIHKT